MGGLVGIVTLVFLFFVYWMFIRPERDVRIARIKMLNDLKEGDYVETLGGLRGVVHLLDNHKKTVDLDCEGIYLVFNKDGIARVIQTAEVRAEEAKRYGHLNAQDDTAEESVTEDTSTESQEEPSASEG